MIAEGAAADVIAETMALWLFSCGAGGGVSVDGGVSVVVTVTSIALIADRAVGAIAHPADATAAHRLLAAVGGALGVDGAGSSCGGEGEDVRGVRRRYPAPAREQGPPALQRHHPGPEG